MKRVINFIKSRKLYLSLIIIQVINLIIVGGLLKVQCGHYLSLIAMILIAIAIVLEEKITELKIKANIDKMIRKLHESRDAS